MPIIGYKTSELPAFYASNTGFSVDYRVDSAFKIAEILKTKRDLSIEGGLLVTNPIPKTFDISADLEELSKTNVCVVCACAKAILDIGLTLEYLETKGVPIIGYKTSELPAFYSSNSGFSVD